MNTARLGLTCFVSCWIFSLFFMRYSQFRVGCRCRNQVDRESVNTGIYQVIWSGDSLLHIAPDKGVVTINLALIYSPTRPRRIIFQLDALHYPILSFSPNASRMGPLRLIHLTYAYLCTLIPSCWMSPFRVYLSHIDQC
jgi:hypothetical protein